MSILFEKPSNEIIIESLEDLPSPESGIITLEDSTIYRIVNAINIGSNRIVIGNNTTIRGNSPVVDYITSSTTGALITSSVNFRIFECGFQANGGTIFDLTGDDSNICLMFGVRFFGTGGLGSVSGYELFEITTGLFVGYSSGLILSGVINYLIMLDATFIDTSGILSIDCTGASSTSIKIANSDFTLIGTGGTALSIAPNSTNIINNGAGIISGCSFVLGATSTAVDGYSTLDTEWSVSNNSNLKSSDRILPTGWGYYVDSQTSPATQTITSTYSKFSIDGGGTASNESYLPLGIRDSSTLWDTVNNKITPVSVGDSYEIRIEFVVDSRSGNPDFIDLSLDIGASASAPTISIVDRTISTSKTPPFSLSVAFPIFTLDTFLTNGGQIFLRSNTGSYVISKRTILITRISSGAI